MDDKVLFEAFQYGFNDELEKNASKATAALKAVNDYAKGVGAAASGKARGAAKWYTNALTGAGKADAKQGVEMAKQFQGSKNLHGAMKDLNKIRAKQLLAIGGTAAVGGGGYAAGRIFHKK